MGIQGVGSIIEYDFQGVDTVSFLVQVVAEIHFVIIIIMGWFNIIYMGIDVGCMVNIIFLNKSFGFICFFIFLCNLVHYLTESRQKGDDFICFLE